MDGTRRGPLVQVLAAMCHYCPICRYGRAKPDSMIGRILSHPLHADHCPMWKAEEEMYGPERRGGGTSTPS